MGLHPDDVARLLLPSILLRFLIMIFAVIGIIIIAASLAPSDIGLPFIGVIAFLLIAVDYLYIGFRTVHDFHSRPFTGAAVAAVVGLVCSVILATARSDGNTVANVMVEVAVAIFFGTIGAELANGAGMKKGKGTSIGGFDG